TGTAASLPATLTVVLPPAITTNPSSRTNNAGTTATFTANSSPASPLDYQWRKDGADLADGGKVSGANSPVLTILDLLKADEGNYALFVTNSAGTAVSDDG